MMRKRVYNHIAFSRRGCPRPDAGARERSAVGESGKHAPNVDLLEIALHFYALDMERLRCLWHSWLLLTQEEWGENAGTYRRRTAASVAPPPRMLAFRVHCPTTRRHYMARKFSLLAANSLSLTFDA